MSNTYVSVHNCDSNGIFQDVEIYSSYQLKCLPDKIMLLLPLFINTVYAKEKWKDRKLKYQAVWKLIPNTHLSVYPFYMEAFSY